MTKQKVEHTDPEYRLQTDEDFLYSSCVNEMFNTEEDLFMWFDKDKFLHLLSHYDVVFTEKDYGIGVHVIPKIKEVTK